jgi:RND family efflux transporter MFP subunit
MRTTSIRTRIVISVILLCGLYLGYRMYPANSDASLLHDTTREEAIPTVAVVSPKPISATKAIVLHGSIVGWYEAPIYAQVTGYVGMWHKDYGDHVKTGDILAEITTPELDAEYRQAQADLESERAKYRLAEVKAKRTVQEQNMNAQAAAVLAAEQKVKNIEALIGFKKIIAPFDGVVAQRNINVGDLVSKEGNPAIPNAKTNLFTVAVVDKLRLFVNVPEIFGPFLHSGLTADVTVPQLPHRHFNFKFLTVDRGFDVGTRTATTVFTIDNEDRALWPVSYGEVHLTTPVTGQAFIMPSTAVVFQEHGMQVAVVTDNNRIHMKTIKVSRRMDKVVVVEEGLSASDRIVNNPSVALLEGDQVRIVTRALGFDIVTGEIKSPEAATPDEQPTKLL